LIEIIIYYLIFWKVLSLVSWIYKFQWRRDCNWWVKTFNSHEDCHICVSVSSG